jgi:recombination protein RecT
MSEAATKTQVPSRAQFKPLNKVDSLAELFKHPDFKERIASAAPKHFNAERLLRTMVLATQKTPKLLEVSPMQMLGACITLAALGLEPNTPLGHAHLIPFEVNKWNSVTRKREYVRTDVQVIIGYTGYLELIYRSAMVDSVHCDVFYQDEVDSGSFSYEHGSNAHLTHKPNGKVRDPKEEPVGAYMYAKLQNGGEVFEVMPAAKIHLARSRSQGYRSAMWAYDQAVTDNKDPLKDKRYTEAPWIKDPDAMWRKTPLRAGQKWLPKSIELAAAVAADERAIDFSQITSGDMVLEGSFAVEEEETEGEGAAKTQSESTPAQTRQATTEPAKQTRTTKAKETPAKEPTKPVPPVMVPDAEVTYPLLNYLGEENDGPFGPAKDPMEFAADFRLEWNKTPLEHRQALMEHNADSVTEAMNRSAEANTVLQVFVIETTPERQDAKKFPEEKYEISRIKTSAGAWDIIDWTNKAKAMMSEFVEVAQFAAFYEVNDETIKALTKTARTVMDNYRAQRMEAISTPEAQEDEGPDFGDVPLPGDEENRPPVTEKVDEWEAAFNQFSADFAKCESLSDLSGIARNAAIKVRLKQLQEARPDLADKLNQAYRAREDTLRAG